MTSLRVIHGLRGNKPDPFGWVQFMRGCVSLQNAFLVFTFELAERHFSFFLTHEVKPRGFCSPTLHCPIKDNEQIIEGITDNSQEKVGIFFSTNDHTASTWDFDRIQQICANWEWD